MVQTTKTESRDKRLQGALETCAAAGETLTPLRQKVLELLWDSAGPAKAYDLLQGLGAHGAAAKPPTIYRALEFLLRMGLAHRIESLNAFVACGGHKSAHAPATFLICEKCSAALELDSGHALHDLEEAAGKQGFTPRRIMIEVFGICAACRLKE